MRDVPDIKAEVTNVKQAQSAVMAMTGNAMDVDSFLKGIALRSFQRFWKGQELRVYLLVLREKRTPSVRVPQETERWWERKVEGCKEGQAKAKESGKARKDSKASASVRQVGAYVERLQVRGVECVPGGRGGALIEEWMLRHGEHRVDCAGNRVSASVRGKSPDSHRNRLMCSGGSVPEESGRRLPRAQDTRESKELQASVGQALARSWCNTKVQVKLKDGSFRCVTREWRIRTEL